MQVDDISGGGQLMDDMQSVTLFDRKSGYAYRVEQDSCAYVYSPRTGDKWTKVNLPGRSKDQLISKMIGSGDFVPFIEDEMPTLEDVHQMAAGYMETTATDGCEGVEPDGHCVHGYLSWPSACGLI